MVYRRTRVTRSTFRKLRNGALYYLAADGTGPFVKMGRRARLATNHSPNNADYQAGTAVADTSVAVIKVDRFSLNSQAATV